MPTVTLPCTLAGVQTYLTSARASAGRVWLCGGFLGLPRVAEGPEPCFYLRRRRRFGALLQRLRDGLLNRWPDSRLRGHVACCRPPVWRKPRFRHISKASSELTSVIPQRAAHLHSRLLRSLLFLQRPPFRFCRRLLLCALFGTLFWPSRKFARGIRLLRLAFCFCRLLGIFWTPRRRLRRRRSRLGQLSFGA